MSSVYAYICTKQTADPFLPPATIDLRTLARDVSDGFYALQGGYFRVGQVSLFPVQRAVANHLLCDGTEISKVSFPELYQYLGDSQGTPADPENFVLPNYVGSLEAATTANPETIAGGTVTSETPSDTGTGVGGSVDYAVDSGARYDIWIPVF